MSKSVELARRRACCFRWLHFLASWLCLAFDNGVQHRLIVVVWVVRSDHPWFSALVILLHFALASLHAQFGDGSLARLASWIHRHTLMIVCGWDRSLLVVGTASLLVSVSDSRIVGRGVLRKEKK